MSAIEYIKEISVTIKESARSSSILNSESNQVSKRMDSLNKTIKSLFDKVQLVSDESHTLIKTANHFKGMVQSYKL